MITIIYGTTGELIKLAPVLISLRERRAPILTLCTGQQVTQIPALLADLGLPEPDMWLAQGRHGRDLERSADLPAWLATVTRTLLRARSSLRKQLSSDDLRPLALVHGDTFTTVLGALWGRSMRLPVAHIEAGLRSGDWRNPFPEELDRLATSRLASIHLAPGEEAATNLRVLGVRGEVVDTGGNTIRDALELVPAVPPALPTPQEPFGLVSLHRFELLNDQVAFKAIIQTLHEAALQMPILFIDHPVTAAAIAVQRLDGLFNESLRRVPRQRYFSFISLVRQSSFLLTDSGGSQEECAQLGHPCLVHRAATERFDGLDGGSVVLSRMDLGVVRSFLANPSQHVRAPLVAATRPTDVILAHLEKLGHVPTAEACENRPLVKSQ